MRTLEQCERRIADLESKLLLAEEELGRLRDAVAMYHAKRREPDRDEPPDYWRGWSDGWDDADEMAGRLTEGVMPLAGRPGAAQRGVIR